MINESLAMIRHDLSALVSMMVSKGHTKATADLIIHADSVCINLNTNGLAAFRWHRLGHVRDFGKGSTFSEAFVAPEKIITESMDEIPEIACAQWFSMENYATAAE